MLRGEGGPAGSLWRHSTRFVGASFAMRLTLGKINLGFGSR